MVGVDGVAGAGEPDRVGAAADLLHLGQPAAEVGPGQPFRDLALDRHRPQRVQHGQAASVSGRASGTTAAGGATSWAMCVVGVPGEPDPDRVGDAVDGDVGDAGQGVGDQLAVRAAVVGIGAQGRGGRARLR